MTAAARAPAGNGSGPHDPSAPLLTVDSIDFSYGRLQILFGVSLEVRRGERLALLGTNGAGKSTVLNVVAGLRRPTAGRVRFNGYDVTDEPAERRCRRGLVLVPGGRAVFPDMTVAENLDIFSYALRSRRDLVEERVERALTTFPRLRDRYRQPAGRLSGGEQQQLALTHALITSPELLCIDELSLGLAPAVVEALFDYVRELTAAGTTVLLVEQSLNVAASLCERAVFMEKGSVRFEGSTAELLERDDIARAVFLAADRH